MSGFDLDALFDLGVMASSDYVQANNSLWCTVYPQVTGAVITINYRVMGRDGRVQWGQFSVTATTQYAANTGFTVLPEGWLLSIVITTNAASQKRGSMYVTCGLGINPSPTSLGTNVRLLLADYLTAAAGMGWPGNQMVSSVEGPGLINSVQIGNPAAGVDWTYTVPAGIRAWIHNVSALFTTAVAVANRIPGYRIKDSGGNQLYIMSASAAQAASLVFNYEGVEDSVLAIDAGTHALVALPAEVYLSAGYVFTSITGAIQAADQWSGINLNLETWIDI